MYKSLNCIVLELYWVTMTEPKIIRLCPESVVFHYTT